MMVLSSWETRKFDQDLKFSDTKAAGQIYLTSGWNTFPVKLLLTDAAKEALISNLAPRKPDGSFANASDIKPGTAFWTYLKPEQLTPEFFNALSLHNAGAIPKESEKAEVQSGWNFIPAYNTTQAWHWDNGAYSFSAPTTDEAIWLKK